MITARIPTALVPHGGPSAQWAARRATTGLVLALAVVLLLLPGSAAASGGSVAASRSGYTTATQTGADGLNSIKVSATFTGAVDGNGLRLVLECDAQAAGVPAATSVTDCSAVVAGVRYETPSLSLPGPAVAVSDTHRTALSAITVCVSGRVVPVFGDDVAATRCVTEGLGVDLDPTLPQAGGAVTGLGYVSGGGMFSLLVCGAVAPGALVTVVVECTAGAGRWSAPSSKSPGPVAASSALITPAGEDTLQACYTVQARFADGSVDYDQGCGLRSLTHRPSPDPA
jgi:hypothetical protein